MLSLDQALSIVLRCLKAVLGRGQPNPSLSTRLDELGFTSLTQTNLLRELIVRDKTVGVPSYAHTIDKTVVADLNPSWTVGRLVDVVRISSVRIER